MKAKNGKHIIGSEAQTAAELIALGQSSEPMRLPEYNPKETSSLTGSNSSPLTNVLATVGDEDEEGTDTNGFVYDDDNVFSRFNGKTPEKKGPKAPSAKIKNLPASKPKGTVQVIDSVTDHAGNVYQYLGEWDGDLSFLDEQAKNVARPPAGSFLYRRPTGLMMGDKMQFEYSVGADPKVSNFGGRNPSFKAIGTRMVPANGEISNALGIDNSAIFYRAPAAGSPITNPYAKVGGSNPSLSGLKNLSPYAKGLITNAQSSVPSFNLGSSFQTIPGTANYYASGGATPSFGYTNPAKTETATSEKGTGFKNVVDSIAGLLGPAAAVISALKSTKNGVGTSPDQSNGGGGIPAGYIANELGGGGGFGGSPLDIFGDVSEESNGGGGYNTGQSLGLTAPKNKTLVYLAIAAAIIGLVIYLKKKKG